MNDRQFFVEKIINNFLTKELSLEPMFFKNNDTLNYFYENGHKNSIISLSQICSIETGKKNANFASDIGKYNFFTCALNPLKSETYSYDGEYLICPGNGANVGHTVYFNGKFEAYQRTYLISLKENEKNSINLKYIYYYFLAFWFKFNKDKLYGSATPYIRLKNLEQFPIYLPSKQSQKKLVESLDKIMLLYDQQILNNQKIDELKIRLKNEVLNKALSGNLIVNDQKLLKENVKQTLNHPYQLPVNWVWTKIKYIGKANIGLTYSPDNVSNSGTIVLRSSNIQNWKIDLTDIIRVDLKIPENKMCKKGDILICARNGSKALVGKAALIPKNGYSFGAFMALLTSKYNEYLFYYLQSPFFRNDIDGLNTTTINQLTQSNLNNRLVPLPPYETQKQIVNKIKNIFELIDLM